MQIGFFDSGLGGLLILKAVAKALPQYDYLYFGDTANLPYGDKTEAEILHLTKQAIDGLFQKDCALVIVACNTASAETIRTLQDTYLKESYPDRRILGVIVPTVETVAAQKPSRVLLIATKRTVESGKYERELQKVAPGISLIAIATPQLVPLIEAHQDDEALKVATDLLEKEGREGDVVILGCTHYTLLKDSLRSHFPHITFVAQDEIIPHKLADYLDRHDELSSKLTNTGKREIQLSEYRADYDRLTAEFLGGVYLPEEAG